MSIIKRMRRLGTGLAGRPRLLMGQEMLSLPPKEQLWFWFVGQLGPALVGPQNINLAELEDHTFVFLEKLFATREIVLVKIETDFSIPALKADCFSKPIVAKFKCGQLWFLRQGRPGGLFIDAEQNMPSGIHQTAQLKISKQYISQLMSHSRSMLGDVDKFHKLCGL